MLQSYCARLLFGFIHVVSSTEENSVDCGEVVIITEASVEESGCVVVGLSKWGTLRARRSEGDISEPSSKSGSMLQFLVDCSHKLDKECRRCYQSNSGKTR
jgi:hypothetical protein